MLGLTPSQVCTSTGTIALDGEREIEFPATSVAEVKLRADGPFVVDVPAALKAAARTGHLQRQEVEPGSQL